MGTEMEPNNGNGSILITLASITVDREDVY